MSYVLAIDVGTSFTAAAIARFDQGSSPAPESLPLGLRGTSVPSVIYFPEDGPILVGEAAERRGLDFPSRVVREFKRRVGDSVPIAVGALSLSPEDVFATMARWVAHRAEEREGEPPSEVVLTHPAAWGSHRTSVILAAMAARGLENVTLISEPEAAALYYASQVRVEDGSTIAVYDLGGGTFDTAVLRKAGSRRFELVGRPEGIENLGGADFDAEVFRYVSDHTGDVLSKLNPADAGVRAALARLRRECVEAKEALSGDSEATISVLLPGVQQQVRLVRSEFEALVGDPVRDTVDALEQSLAGMELKPADLSAVLLIGGSSRIPLVAQLISEQLDRPIAVDADPKSSICMGAAVSAVLARAEVPEAKEATAAAPAEAGITAVGLAAAEHFPGRPASWSRKSATAAGAVDGAAHGHGHSHGGAHAPKPAVRLTAIAAAAAVVSVLTATAAQSPGGLSSLTSILVPEAGAAPGTESAPGGIGGGGSGPGQGAAAAGGAPVAGIEAGLDTNVAPAGGAGLEVAASPTSRPSSSAVPGKSQAGAGTNGGAAAGPGTGAPAGAGGSTPGAGAGGGAGPGTQDPAGTPVGTDPGTGQPTVPGTTDPGTVPGTPPPVDPPPADPAPAVDPAPADPPPADPPPADPAPADPPPAEPAPVDPAPEPTLVVTQSVDPVTPTAPVPASAPLTTSEPAA
ncbi:Hsp70 family protein [Arthrobacter sp. ZGTC412]|uniref:Hsp70 family protein n=1 Tax=Arthrobacter sp. ZGTC412 TaxID=2058900 RepID=UPI000CE3506F|nr:Hsp70 family protein [Arthrobacter sp. ZGTC412]